MADVIHEHDSGGSSMGFLFGLIAVILFMYILFAYGLPYMRSGTSAPAVNVPDQVDVNLNNQGGQQ